MRARAYLITDQAVSGTAATYANFRPPLDPISQRALDAVRDWLARGTKGLSAKTINDYTSLAESNLIPFIGAKKLKGLTADNVGDWLEGRAPHLTTRTMQVIHSILRRTIRRAQARDKVMRNVATLVDTPEGEKAGRPSKAMTLDQAMNVVEHAMSDPLHAYVVLSFMTGVRAEEARALHWSHVVAWVPEKEEWRPVTEVGFHYEKYAVYVWRSVREDGAAAKASLSAHADGERDPLYYLRDELEAQGHLHRERP
jgi:hypothetical protein